jgi:hypothetical protein
MNPTHSIIVTLSILIACGPVLLAALYVYGALRPEPMTRRRVRMSPEQVERTLALADLRRRMNQA